MRVRSGRLALLACVLAGVTLIVASCAHDHCTNPESTLPARQSPQQLLETFAESMEHRDIAKYEDCLDDAYTFVFMAQDWDSAGVTSEQPYWGKTEDLARTAVMFTSALVTSIRFDPGLAVYDFSGPYPLLEAVYRPVIDVIVERQGEETLTYQVRHSLLTFVVTQDPGNQYLWVIKTIGEFPAPTDKGWGQALSVAGTELSTFGSVKAMFK